MRFFAEAVLIVSSVYLAIALEGASAERGQRSEAVAALSALRVELESDQLDAIEIIALQEEQGRSSDRIQVWLSHPETLPADSFSTALLHVLTDNRTMFPRKASWTTMVSEGQLAVLGAPDLIGRLANLYEHSNVRLEYNGDRYDDTTQELLRSHLPYVWDFNGRRLLDDDPVTIRTFANVMLQVQRQNRGYTALLTAWATEVESVQAVVESYLGLRGGGV